jgi:hypothetical protein
MKVLPPRSLTMIGRAVDTADYILMNQREFNVYWSMTAHQLESSKR